MDNVKKEKTHGQNEGVEMKLTLTLPSRDEGRNEVGVILIVMDDLV